MDQTTIEMKPLVSLQSEGILLVDKPSGITSHDVVDWARRVTGVRRIGHTGTLDPLATGLLVLLISRKYTKLQEQFLKQDKEYICEAELGIETDTYDIDGQIVAKADWQQIKQISKSDLKRTMQMFKGKVDQTVPPFSAVKREGKKLYELAREGKIDKKNLPSRNVQIHSLVLTKYSKDEVSKKISFQIKTSCSSGTYVRSLVNDIGNEFGVGATVTSLRRTRIGNFSILDALVCPLKYR